MLPVFGKKAVLEWCMKEGLIGSSYVCPKCGESMELRQRTVAQQSMRARNNYAHPNISDYWALRCMNRCPDLVVCLKRDLQCLRPQASLVLIYRPNVAGMESRVNLAQPVNSTQDLCCGSTIYYHSILFGEK
ncbi:hypothetical protein TNCV_3066591 [Trichonephila clavipes]|nr:hypothetical protein TNCV_3066591 [Trichonephila clavipes]